VPAVPIRSWLVDMVVLLHLDLLSPGSSGIVDAFQCRSRVAEEIPDRGRKEFSDEVVKSMKESAVVESLLDGGCPKLRGCMLAGVRRNA